MKKHIYIAVLLIVLVSCKEVSKQEVVKDGNEVSTILFQQTLDSIYKAHPTSKGLMIHIEMPDSGISWSGAVGISDTISKAPIDPGQPALIASNTKTYTAVTILRLVEEGKLKLDQAIESLISEKSSVLLSNTGYDLQGITVAHLLSHTSGIRDYVNEDYMNAIDQNKKHRWTRDEQIELSMKIGGPLASPGVVFSYADINFLLATEIIEPFTGEPFNKAIARWIGFENQGLTETWFVSLDSVPSDSKPLVCQYYSEVGWNSYELDPSFDLYGAGGIAATTKDLALFSQRLFEGKIVKDPKVLELIYTKMPIKEGEDPHYLLGIMDSEYNGYEGYGHGGFWGTTVQYFPELNASVAVYVLERDNRILRLDILESVVNLMAKNKL